MTHEALLRTVQRSAAVLALALLALPVLAQPGPSDGMPKLDAEKRDAILKALSADIDKIYVFPDVATKMIEHLKAQQESGAYKNLDAVPAFTAQLTSDLQSISHDLHLRVSPIPPGEVNARQEVDMEEIRRRYRERARRSNYGFEKVEILDGNVGYLDLRGFVDAAIGGRTAVAAMGFLGGSDAVIIDLRQNGGGDPSMIQLISSYFFDEPVHLNSFYIRREDKMDQFWTQAYVEGPRLTETPLYVLTSGRTFSAAEEFTYNMRNLERATIIGETTGGGAHPVDMMRYPELGVRMSLPFGRAVNPVTGTNWEGTGVEPHVKVPADGALKVAYAKALETLVASATDPDHKQRLDWTLEGANAETRTLSAAELQAYVGVYGPRKVRLEDGKLVYQRDEGPVSELVPVGGDNFHVAGITYFRIRFERGADGKVVTLVGRYDDGTEEPSPRSDG